MMEGIHVIILFIGGPIVNPDSTNQAFAMHNLSQPSLSTQNKCPSTGVLTANDDHIVDVVEGVGVLHCLQFTMA